MISETGSMSPRAGEVSALRAELARLRELNDALSRRASELRGRATASGSPLVNEAALRRLSRAAAELP